MTETQGRRTSWASWGTWIGFGLIGSPTLLLAIYIYLVAAPSSPIEIGLGLIVLTTVLLIEVGVAFALRARIARYYTAKNVRTTKRRRRIRALGNVLTFGGVGAVGFEAVYHWLRAHERIAWAIYPEIHPVALMSVAVGLGLMLFAAWWPTNHRDE